MTITAQQRKNIETYLFYWKSIPKENVSKDLEYFRSDFEPSDIGTASCQTIACAGGWLALMPPFVEMGIRPDIIGAPVMNGVEDSLATCFLSKKLFGNSNLFLSRLPYEKGSDHAVVRKRFEKLLEQ
jgi:hypothetical protein